MSRIGKLPIPLPKGVDVTLGGGQVSVKGPLGTLSLPLCAEVAVQQDNGHLVVQKTADTARAAAMWGTSRALLAAMVEGVSQGFEKKLTLVGVGYRAQVQGDTLNLSLGFSHPVVYKAPKGVTITTPTQTEIVVKGMDKQQVGQVAAEVRAFREPEPYKGKGVRYADEVVVLKETKKK